jgi:hypothetical protein
MFQTPICLEVIAADELDEAYADMGIKREDIDLYSEPTFPVCFWKFDCMMPDNRSTAKKPLTIIVCGELTYIVKFSMEHLINLVDVHR